MRRTKYNATRTQVDGIWFASKLEAKRYGELVLMKRANLITDLELQPRLRLQDPFTDILTKKRIRAIDYIPDFRYREIPKGNVVYEDVKGRETAVFRLKYRMCLHAYPGIALKIVKG